jgi:hypothetical protein
LSRVLEKKFCILLFVLLPVRCVAR